MDHFLVKKIEIWFCCFVSNRCYVDANVLVEDLFCCPSFFFNSWPRPIFNFSRQKTLHIDIHQRATIIAFIFRCSSALLLLSHFKQPFDRKIRSAFRI